MFLMNEQTSDSGGTAAVEQRVSQLEATVASLIEAVEALARGLEDGQPAQPRSGQAAKAARRAHELLLLAKAGEPVNR